MNKFLYTFLLLMFGLVSVPAHADLRNVTFNIDHSEAAKVYNSGQQREYTWGPANKIDARLTENDGIQILAQREAIIDDIKVNGITVSSDIWNNPTSAYFTSEQLNNGDVVDIKAHKLDPRKMIVKGDASRFYVESGSKKYEAKDFVNGQCEFELETYAQTTFYAKDGYFITSAISNYGEEYNTFKFSTNCYISNNTLPEGTTTITVVALSEEEARPCSFNLKIIGDQSNVKIQRNSSHASIPLDKSGEYTIRFDPEYDLPFLFYPAKLNSEFYKLEVNGEAVEREPAGYYLNLQDKDEVVVTEQFIDQDVPFTFNFVNEGTEESVTLYVDNKIVPASVWNTPNFTLKLGQVYTVDVDNLLYDIKSTKMNGEPFNFMAVGAVTDPNGYVFDIEVVKYPPYIVTFHCDPTTVQIKNNAHTQPYKLTGDETKVEVYRNEKWITITPLGDNELTEVLINGEQGGSLFYVEGDMTVDIKTRPFGRYDTFVFYVDEDTPWTKTNIILSSNIPAHKLVQTLEKGYNLVKFHISDLPIKLDIQPEPVIYMEDFRVYPENGNYTAFGTIMEGVCIKAYGEEAVEYKVTFDIATDANVQVYSDRMHLLRSYDDYMAMNNTEFTFVPEDTNDAIDLIVTANGVPVKAGADGNIIVKINNETNIKAERVQSSILEVESKQAQCGDVYNILGVKVLTNATEADLNNLTHGIYILNGKKILR